MSAQECGKTVLARGPCAEVTRCACGHIHLAVGPVTLRLDEDILRALGLTLAEAVRRLAGPAETETPAMAGAPHGVTTGGWKQ
ncbi:hypothetical protein DRW03_12275 [Corallococcus sp. H22C18031201]|uniref:hypothetical protein n=1 Tax=Citreicoccus inhibens TaxID=2849499 RepID=UPI000E7382D1|nr:hypothetical protein [Citreicoccus inhibens]MBU8894203.1 hypothetical protein [Citreicoccus inhibens]RJS23097.1 hypothetical protein DRW03_12275 [Corallococcus sp. H22C18031201]